jgi:RHS repeat-associated protein
MKQGGQYYWYHNDHLGTPQMITTSYGAVVWSAKYGSFLNATVDASSIIENSLRVSGQYEDTETELHYNYHRYYDPQIGRYLRVDPIGFEGGLNLYAYVQNDPINFLDSDALLRVKPGGEQEFEAYKDIMNIS